MAKQTYHSRRPRNGDVGLNMALKGMSECADGRAEDGTMDAA